MIPSIFLSVSFVDVGFVQTVYARLPRGVARYYERGFDRGEDLIAAMERSLDESEVYVLFASSDSLASYAVNFELEEARYRKIFGKIKKVLVFPIEPGLTYGNLPVWLQRSWVPNAGESPVDIARYLTTLLLEPDRGLSPAAPNVIGRGTTVDLVRRLSAAHLQKHRSAPKVYIFAGITGIGRRTFAAYFLRNGLGALANLPYGPQIQLSPQAELVDLYRALRVETDPRIPLTGLAADQATFLSLSQEEQIAEIIRVMSRFTTLGQAVTIVSAAGFFEDAATPKSWVAPLFKCIPDEQIIVAVTNIQFRDDYIEALGVAVQLRIEELHDEDIRALMIFTAKLVGVEEFRVSDRLLSAIGGHPDVANSAVRLAKQKGLAILDRDPSQLFNIQKLIIGGSIRSDTLKPAERLILDVLGWLPVLGSDLLERIVISELKVSHADFDQAIESLILGCLIYATGYKFSIASSIRQLYRRYNVTDGVTLEAMAKVFAEEWSSASAVGFRDDLFSAFVFMHVLEGKSLPRELRALLTPSNLYEAVRDAYARGKETEENAPIQQAIEWGKLALEMSMGDGVREEILSTVARAEIRLGQHDEAAKTIAIMKRYNFRSVTFLEGHSLRKRRKFEDAIPKLRFVLEHNRQNRSAVHELALCYRRLRKTRELESLLKDYGEILDENPMFLDFIIALNISRGERQSIPASIERLRQLDDNSNRADLRHAQFLAKQGNEKGAFEFLSDVLTRTASGSIRLRAARAIAAVNINKIRIARDDLAMIKSVEKNDVRSNNIETHILLAEGRRREAYELNQRIVPQEPSDWHMRAKVLEALAGDPTTGISEAAVMRQEAERIRAQHGPDLDYILED